MATSFFESRRARAVLAAVIAAWLAFTTFGEAPGLLDAWLYDGLVGRALPPLPSRNDVIFVEADEESLEQLHGGWPLDRALYAALLRKLAEARPAVVALDVWFPEPASSPASSMAQTAADALRDTPGLDTVPEAQALADRLDEQATKLDSDRQLMEALSGVPVILGVGQAEIRADALNVEGGMKLPAVPGVDREARTANRLGTPSLSHPSLAESAAGHASLVVALGRGVVRRYPFVLGSSQGPVASLALAAVQRARPDQAEALGRWVLEQDGATPLVRFPVLPRTRLASTGRPPARSVRLVDVLEAEPGSPALSAFKDALVFVGVSASGAGEMDRRSTPLGEDLPGTWLHVSAATQLLERAALVTGGRAGTAWRVAAGALCGLALLLSLRVRRNGLVVLLTVGAAAAWSALALGLLWNGRWVPVVPVLLALAMVALGELVLRGGAAELARRRIRHAFAHYVGPSVVEQLVREPHRLRLGGERRTVTAFFSDIKGFTTVSEQLDPAELVSVLNGYLGPMTEIILEEGGTIDKYIGDAIVAMWGAPLDQPDHAQRACRAAVRCQLKLEEIRRACAAKGLPELHVRIGLNSGEALVGNLGSESRFDYTMIGDTVNLAARLEGANSVYGTRILCGERTLELARGAVELRELDLLQVKGKTRGVRVAEVAALSGALEGPTADRFARFAEALAALRAREFERAKSSFEVLAAEGDAPSAVMAERCAEWLAQPPPPTWDGSYKLTTK